MVPGCRLAVRGAFVGASLLFLLVNVLCAVLSHRRRTQPWALLLVRVLVSDSLFVLCALSLAACLCLVARRAPSTSIYLEAKVGPPHPEPLRKGHSGWWGKLLPPSSDAPLPVVICAREPVCARPRPWGEPWFCSMPAGPATTWRRWPWPPGAGWMLSITTGTMSLIRWAGAPPLPPGYPHTTGLLAQWHNPDLASLPVG